MDINMPILDGIEATIQIKHNHEDIVIIACTAFTDTETRNTCYKSGMSYHLSKPVKKE
jgi:CheY-like chemotaxis protein